jgi:hypothetical protein
MMRQLTREPGGRYFIVVQDHLVGDARVCIFGARGGALWVLHMHVGDVVATHN